MFSRLIPVYAPFNKFLEKGAMCILLLIIIITSIIVISNVMWILCIA